MAVSFRGNSIHAPSRDLSVLPSRSEARRGWLAVARRYHGAARGSCSWRLNYLSEGLTQSRLRSTCLLACLPACLSPRIAALAGPRNLRKRERERESSPQPHKPIVLQLLTALLPNEGLIAFECFDSCHAIGASDCSVASALLPVNLLPG